MKKKKANKPTIGKFLCLTEFLDDSCSILDVGANKGQFHHSIKKLFPNSTIASVEPNPFCEVHLKSMQAEYYICGLGAEETFLDLILPKSKKISKGASYYPADWLTEETSLIIKTPVHTGDRLFSNRKFDVIKIDTQGYELEVLKGATRLLKDAKILIIECNIVAENIGAPHWSAIIEYLKPFGFFVYKVLDERKNSQDKIFQIDCIFMKNIKSHDPIILEYL